MGHDQKIDEMHRALMGDLENPGLGEDTRFLKREMVDVKSDISKIKDDIKKIKADNHQRKGFLMGIWLVIGSAIAFGWQKLFRE